MRKCNYLCRRPSRRPSLLCRWHIYADIFFGYADVCLAGWPCADADGFFSYADVCLARWPCANGFRSCADGSGPSAPWLAAVVYIGIEMMTDLISTSRPAAV
jgi:hypothetical protein